MKNPKCSSFPYLYEMMEVSNLDALFIYSGIIFCHVSSTDSLVFKCHFIQVTTSDLISPPSSCLQILQILIIFQL